MQSRRGPDELTSHLANGGSVDGEELRWVAQHLAQLRLAKVLDYRADTGLSLKELGRVYLGARIVQGSIIASHLALPAVIEAGEALRNAQLPEDLDAFAEVGAAQVEAFLSGAEGGQARRGTRSGSDAQPRPAILDHTDDPRCGIACRNDLSEQFFRLSHAA